MKKILILSLSLIIASCSQQSSENCQALEAADSNVKRNIDTYVSTWEAVFGNRDISAINTENYDTRAIVVTAQGNVEGIDALKAHYNNYLTGFSDAEFSFIDVFGQGDKIVKHWNFKGTHDGEMFGIPPTNNKVDINGTTLIQMKESKVVQEQDFFDNHLFLTQLGLLQ